MTDFDLERLGDVWRQQPDPAELERLQRSAAAVGRRARWARLFNIGAAIVVAAIVLFIVFANPQRSSVLMGSAAIFLLLYSNIRSRRIRDIELRGLTGTTENMLDQSIERVGATLKYNLFTLIGLGPAIVIGYLFADSATSSGEGGISMLSPEIRFMLGAGGVIAIASSVAFLLLAVRRGRRELQRLAAMRDSFREERKSSNY
jgi:hypothetical protein